MKMRSIKVGFAAVSMLWLLSGCGTYTVSKDVNSAGRASEVIFPSLDGIVMKEGTFPNRANLRSIGSGMTKDQLYDLIGRPHFREAFHAHEWDYLFNFRQPDGSVVRCQYKVLFDKDFLGQSFYWSPASCVDQLIGTVAVSEKAEPATPAKAPTIRRINLDADALFAFDKYGRGDILPGGREKVDALAKQLTASKVLLIQVVGHTDRLGSEIHNAILSQHRAETIRSILIEDGVSADIISAIGLGEARPVKECSDNLARAELIRCLQPNRRVEVAVSAME